MCLLTQVYHVNIFLLIFFLYCAFRSRQKYYNWFGSEFKGLVTLPPNASSVNDFWVLISKYSENNVCSKHFKTAFLYFLSIDKYASPLWLSSVYLNHIFLKYASGFLKLFLCAASEGNLSYLLFNSVFYSVMEILYVSGVHQSKSITGILNISQTSFSALVKCIHCHVMCLK